MTLLLKRKEQNTMKMQGEPINLPSMLSQVADIGLTNRSSRNLQIHPACLLESNKYFLSLYDDEYNGSEDENKSSTERTFYDTKLISNSPSYNDDKLAILGDNMGRFSCFLVPLAKKEAQLEK